VVPGALLLAYACPGSSVDCDENPTDPACPYVQTEADVKVAAFAGPINQLSPLPDVPADPTNKYADNADAAALGQQLYWDRDFAGPIGAAAGDFTTSPLGAAGEKCKVACSDCHSGLALPNQPAMLSDGSVDHGALDDRKTPNHIAIGTGKHPHNSPAVVNSSFYDWVNWNGRFKRQWELPLPVYENGVIMNGNRMRLTRIMAAKYKDEYNAVFGADTTVAGGGPLDDARIAAFPVETTPGGGKPSNKPGCGGGGKTTATDTTACSAYDGLAAADQDYVTRVGVNYSKALHAYIRKLVARNAPFDKYVASGFKSYDINESAKRGLELFVNKAACVKCHSTPLFSDSTMRNTGVKHIVGDVPAPGATDSGRFNGENQLAVGVTVASKWSDDATTGKMLLAEVLTLPTGAPGAVVTGTAGCGAPSGGVNGNPANLTCAPDVWKGQFRDKGLREVAITAPYMHSGEIKTLEEVVKFYNVGGDADGFAGVKDSFMVPLNLTDAEQADLVEFMKSLTGEPLDPALLKDTSKATLAGTAACQ